MSTTYSMTMANMKPDDPESSVWHGYSLQTPTSSASQHAVYDASYQTAPMAIPYHGRPQKGAYRSLDLPALHSRPSAREENHTLATSPPILNTHHSYPSLKRGFQGENEMPYMENVQYFRDEPTEIAKPTINQDHRLLNFGKSPDKHTIIDSQGRVKQIDLTAQIHGMFFLSELATTPVGESLLAQPELTCYRRNLFQISGNVSLPRGPLSVVSERGERVSIVSQELCISATESVDGHVVKLIVIPWKTPPPNSPEVALGQEHEPAPISLIDYGEGRLPSNESVLFPIAYRRLQFRIATANNGRRRELQQHFTLHLHVVGTLANGVKVNLCESSTAPIVVRGRSPRNFQARKEIPLVGSSSSRGHPSDLQAATNSTPQNIVIPRRATVPKPGALELPRVPFTFDSTALSGSPSMPRQPTYQSWSASNTPVVPDQTSASLAASSYPSSAISLDSFLQAAPPPPSTLLSSPHIHSTSSSTNAMTAPPIPSTAQPARHYNFPTDSNSLPTTISGTVQPPLRFVDSNPRPVKSPRHTVPPELPSSAYSEYGARFAPPYQGTGSGGTSAGNRTTEYFPTKISMPTTSAWTTGTDAAGLYGTAATNLAGSPQMQGSATNQHYDFPVENYGKTDGEGAMRRQSQQQRQQQQHYAWNQS